MTAEEKGLPPNSVFSGDNVDVVNLQNGNLHISIPIETSAQRGGTVLKWAYVYDTQAWVKQWNSFNCPSSCTPSGQYLPAESTSIKSGWRLSSPYNWAVTNTSSDLNCATTNQAYQQYTNWAVIDPEGTQHMLPLRMETGTSSCLGQTLAGPALDGSGLYYDGSAQILYTKDGYQFSGKNFVLNAGQDRNGNEVSTTSDTLGRNLVITTAGPMVNGLQSTIYTINNSAGEPLQFQVNFQYVTVKSDICAATAPGGPAPTCTDISGTYALPSALILPTGKSYVFKYAPNTPGDLIELDLPTGAAITYTYEDFYQEKANSLQPSYPTFVGSRAVTSRTVDVNGTGNKWTYNPGPITDKVTDPLLNYQIHTFSSINAMNGTQLVASPNVYEQNVAYYNSSGQLLKTTTNTWKADYDPVNNSTANARVTQVTTVWPNNQTSAVQTDYETFSYPCVNAGGACTGTGSRLNPTEVREYDYGSGAAGALLRTTDYCYLHTNNQNYLSLNIVDKPTMITVTDTYGTVAQTVNEYDIYGHTSQSMQPSNAIQHNTSYGTTFTTRGSLTAISKWLNTGGPANTNCTPNTTSGFLTTTMQYDDAGNVLSTIDPMLNKTSYSFADSWANTACNPQATQGVPNPMTAAFPTKITNAKGQSVTKYYYACTGKVWAVTDPNLQNTFFTYDQYDRPYQISYPDTGLKTFCYGDISSASCYNANELLSTETDIMNGSASMVQTTLYDALGRPLQTQVNSDPSGAIYVNTQYDGDGRAYKVTNPYRSGDPVYWTTQLYDGIGRSAGVTRQDGYSTSITYNGNISQSTDEAGNKRNAQYDALGRLTGVWEDPSGLNYETDYQYNGLGDLLQATQKGGGSSPRTRTFTYNSLGWLLCAANPEITAPATKVAACPVADTGSYIVGTTRYSYDKNGNLLSRIAPQPNQKGSAAVTTAYSYDALNRVLSKTFSDGSTPSTCYQYDASTLGVGRLTAKWTQSASVSNCSATFPPSSKYQTAWAISAYDPMGRVLYDQEHTPSSIAAGEPYPMAYTYDLIGDLTSYTAGAAPPSMTFSSPATCQSASPYVTAMLAFSNCYDSAGHLQVVSSNANIGPTNVFSGPVYAAFGGMMTGKLGSNAVSIARAYDSRLRIVSESDMGNGSTTATSGATTVTITGAEQSQ